MMILHSRKLRQSKKLAVAALAAAGLAIAAGPMTAQTTAGPTQFAVPDDICTWDWTGPVTPWLLAELKEQNLLGHTSVHLAKNCPQKLCEIQWEGYSVPEDFQEHGYLPDEMLCELSHRQLFFEDVLEAVAAVCPDVAQVMDERAPEVYESCGTWPRVEPGGNGVPVRPTDDQPGDDIPDDDVVDVTAEDFDSAPT